MVKQLLGIIGSPRKHGNCEMFIKEVYTSFPREWELSLVRLPDWDIRPCKACYQCLFGEMQCAQRDEFNQLLDLLAGCDAYVVAAPTYLLAANASLKVFLDRGLSFYGKLEAMWAKPAAAVAIAGIAGLILGAAAEGLAVVIDGLISTAGAVIAYELNPAVSQYLFAGHLSVEQGHRVMLAHMGLRPLVDLDLRLGEGTGAAVGIWLVEAGVKVLTEMLTFDEAGVTPGA